LTAALLDAGLTEEQIRRVMGENALAFLVSQLP
jgi:microsomal dipeptidase-like Zn-dependent dipeptidase